MNSGQEIALAELKEVTDTEHLWNCIVAFQNVPFFTASGLPFSYQLKMGRNGEYNRELLVDRQAKSKSLVFSSVCSAFKSALEKQGEVIIRPKALGDIRGISYIYPLLYAFGVIDVPDKTKEVMVRFEA